MNPTIEQIKLITKAISEDFRVATGNLNLFDPENPYLKGTVKGKGKGYLILLLSDYLDKGEDIDVACKGLGWRIAELLGIKCSPNDFK